MIKALLNLFKKKSYVDDCIYKSDSGPRLSVELVPEPCWYSNLRYLVSEATWDYLRRETYANAKFHCQICGSQGDKWPVECHEIWDYDDINKIQYLRGLIALCPSCHSVKHMGHSRVVGKGEDAFQHLMKVNSWDRNTAENYLDLSYSEWNLRNSYSWKTDISWLEKKLRVDVERPSPKDETCRIGPLRINFSTSNFSCTVQNHEFWNQYLSSLDSKGPAALEVILPLVYSPQMDMSNYQEMVVNFVQEHLIYEGLYAQINIHLPNPINESLEEEKRCLGFSQAHILMTLYPWVKKGKFLRKIPQELIGLLKSLCLENFPHVPGKFNFSGIPARWLTKDQVLTVSSQNAGEVRDFLYQTTEAKQMRFHSTESR